MLQAYFEWNNFCHGGPVRDWRVKQSVYKRECVCLWVSVRVCDCACGRVCVCCCNDQIFIFSNMYIYIYIYTLRLQPELGPDNELNATCMCIPLRVTYDSCLFVGWEPPTTVTSEYPPSITLRALVQGRNTCYTWGRMPWQLSRAVYLRAEVPLTCILEMEAPVSAVLRIFSFYSVFCRRIVR